MKTLLASVAALHNKATSVHILIADNTPGGQEIEPLPAAVSYKAYPNNPGLAEPYNDALAQAQTLGFDWLLTLDQDTSLPSSFLGDIASVATRYESDARVGAIVPRITDRGRQVSPFRFWGSFFPYVLPAKTAGLSGPHTSALNSASLLRVQTLQRIGGYDQAYPLHNSDTRLYQQLDAIGARVVIAAHVVVPHELSILDRQNRMSPERYRYMLEDECAFWDCHMGFAGRMERFVRLLGRFVKGVLQNEEAAFQAITQSEIRRRALTRRKVRIASRNAANVVRTMR